MSRRRRILLVFMALSIGCYCLFITFSWKITALQNVADHFDFKQDNKQLQLLRLRSNYNLRTRSCRNIGPEMWPKGMEVDFSIFSVKKIWHFTTLSTSPGTDHSTGPGTSNSQDCDCIVIWAVNCDTLRSPNTSVSIFPTIFISKIVSF